MGKLITGALFVLLATPVVSEAVDAGAIMAGMPTPETECRYLKQLFINVKTAEAAVATHTDDLQLAERRLGQSVQHFQSALQVLQAKYGTDNPCADAQQAPPSQIPEAAQPSVPHADPSVDTTQSLIEDWKQGRITLDEYRRRRDASIAPERVVAPPRPQPATVSQQSVPLATEIIVPRTPPAYQSSVSQQSVPLATEIIVPRTPPAYQSSGPDPMAALLVDFNQGRISLEEYRRRRDAIIPPERTSSPPGPSYREPVPLATEVIEPPATLMHSSQPQAPSQDSMEALLDDFNAGRIGLEDYLRRKDEIEWGNTLSTPRQPSPSRGSRGEGRRGSTMSQESNGASESSTIY